MDEIIISTNITEALEKVASFMDYDRFSRIISKITDYSEIITQGKLEGIINYSHQLDSFQITTTIAFLIELQAISKIYLIAQKGTRDLEEEYVSNIFSHTANPDNNSTYINIRNMIENRLNHQIQQYNMNMKKLNATMAMSVRELREHVKMYNELSQNEVITSHKAQHGYIAASLHDAYIIILNKKKWWNDRSYMKFFFNDVDSEKRDFNIVNGVSRLNLIKIEENIKKVFSYLDELNKSKKISNSDTSPSENIKENVKSKSNNISTNKFSDKLLMTPFGRQYGKKIDSIIREIFSDNNIKKASEFKEEDIREMVSSLMQIYKTSPGYMTLAKTKEILMNIVYYLLAQDYGLKVFTEKFIYNDTKISFAIFYDENRSNVEGFITQLFVVFFEESFNSIFKIVRSFDMKQYACAFIIKRIYLIQGENLLTFGYFLIKSIAKYGKIKVF